MERQKRYENLDGLRAWACLGIAAMHLLAGGAGYPADGLFWNRVVPSWSVLVDLFMLLSGFGVCAGYLDGFRSGTVSLEQFYRRRYGKILPFFAVTTLIGVAAQRSLQGLAEGFMELTLLFGLLPNNSNCFQVNGVCWTLGTIFVFYLLFPFFTCVLANRKRAWIGFAVSLGIQALCEVLFMTEGYVAAGFVKRTSFLYSMPFFLAGGLLYLYRQQLEQVVGKLQWLFLLLAAGASMAYYALPDQIGSFGLIDLKALAVYTLWAVYAIGAKSFLCNNPLTRIVAPISMEIYLSHMILLRGLHFAGIDALLGKGAVSYFAMYAILLAATIVFVLAVKALLQRIGGYVKKRFQRGVS